MRYIYILGFLLKCVVANAQSDACYTKYQEIVNKSRILDFVYEYTALDSSIKLLGQLKPLMIELESCFRESKKNNGRKTPDEFDDVSKSFGILIWQAKQCSTYSTSLKSINYKTYNSNLNQFKKNLLEYRDMIFPDREVKKTIENIKGTVNTIKEDQKAFIDTTGISLKKANNAINTAREEINVFKESTDFSFKETGNSFQKSMDTGRAIKAATSVLITSTDSIIYFLYKRDISLQQITYAGAYSDGLYSFGYVHVFDKARKKFSPFALGGEIVFPLNSKNYKRIGGAISFGVQHRNFFIQAGVIFLDNDIERQNISWKGTFLYHPYKNKFLFGFSYSPLFNTGIVIGYWF